MDALISSLLVKHSRLRDSELNFHLSQLGSYNEEQKVIALNSLLATGEITITEEGGEIMYHHQNEDQAKSIKQLHPQETLILQLVREAGNKGVWNAEIKNRTEIPIAQINKIFKNLEKQGLIYSVKSIAAKNRNIWLLTGVEPSKEVTGGFLFTEQEFDRNLLGLLITHAKLFLQERPGTLKEITMYLKQNVDKNLNEQNVKEVVNSLLALHEIEDAGAGKYTTIRWEVPDPLVIPCIACPLQRECNENGLINPAECEYLTNWLDY